ncbi:MAG TPA: ATP-binding protein [Candidatus Krumholzibacteria bacterium]|nr:ATP-binding protein [Candidatus Krumholzibacteria bacterium]
MAGPGSDLPRDDERALAVAGVVHDVNQMLTVIGGRVELLRLRGTLMPGDLDAIALAARDAAAMLRRLTAGPADRGMPAAEIGPCLEAAALVHQPRGEDWSGRWSLAIEAAPQLAVAVPAQVVREVVGNLVANAVEAMAGGGRLVLRAAAAGGRVTVEVADNGPGLPADQRERIFAAGFSAHGGAGRGIGLAASRQLLAAWGGTLACVEQDAPGATFVLDLPRAGDAAGLADAVGEDRLPEPVLVVDDEPAVRDVLLEVLGAWGLRAAAVADTEAARAAWLAGRHPLVLVDQTLPGVPGLELADWLRQRPDRPAVVLMTGVDRAHALPADAAGRCDAVMAKPLDFPALRGLLARAVAAARLAAAEEGTR